MRETIAVCAVLTILAGTAHADGISDVNDCNDANERGDYEPASPFAAGHWIRRPLRRGHRGCAQAALNRL
jgi:hypothetical protein